MIHNIHLRLLDLSLRLPTPPPQDSTLPNEQVRMQRRVRNRRRPTVSGVAILDTQQLVGSPVEERIRTAVADMLELLPAGVDLDTPFMLLGLTSNKMLSLRQRLNNDFFDFQMALKSFR